MSIRVVSLNEKNTLLHSSAASVLTDGNHKMNNLRDPCHFLRQDSNNRGEPTLRLVSERSHL